MGKQIKLIVKICAFTGITAVSLMFMQSSAQAAPATFTVTNTNDSGDGSLRKAIQDSNSNVNPDDMDIIEFNIPGGGVHTITPLTEMDAISQKVTIDGYSQPGASENTAPYPQPFNGTILIEISGASVPAAAGIKAQAVGTVVKGLSVFGFTSGIYTERDEFLIQGNFVGLRADGLTPAGNVAGVGFIGAGADSRIGGENPAERNVIAANTEVNVNLFTALAFGGQPVDGAAVWGNFIGANKNGIAIEGNQGIGVLAYAEPSEILIGGTEAGQGNLIVGTGGTGVAIARFTAEAFGVSLDPTKIAVLGNSIYDTRTFDFEGFGNSDLGIDILEMIDTNDPPDGTPNEFGDRGPNPNDDGDTDEGPNTKINTPILKSAQQDGDQLTITYDLDAAGSPSNTYRVEFFASSKRTIFGHGPGENFLGAAATVAPGDNKTITLTVDGDFTMDALSATTTAIDATTVHGFGATSELARNIPIGSDNDFDADGITDSVEDGAPNNGDGNNDGTLDKEQPTVTSYIAADNVYATLATEGCGENGTVSSLGADTLQTKDNGYEYPFGLADFTLYCSRGDTVDVTMLVHAEDEPEKYIPRKFNPDTNIFSDIPGSTLTSETVGESKALQLVYSIKDGGDLDDDGEENGIIVDPVGLATEQSGVLANTGTLLIGLIPVGLIMIIGAVYTYIDYRRHKKPLQQADPFMASTYTYWHHLKVVAIPMAKYRLSIRVERKQTIPVIGP